LIFDAVGNLYGTTRFGGNISSSCTYSLGCGLVFEVSPPGGGGAWTETVLYTFTGGSDGSIPFAGVIFDAKGNLYGTTLEGGADSGGVVFELPPPNFTISASPEVVVLPPGGSVTSTITTVAEDGFDSAITLSASGQPSGLAVSFHQNPIPAPGSGSSTMTMKMGSQQKNKCYPITVTGTGAGVTRTTRVQMWVGTPTGGGCL
jgi:uncharacterized repeat protein (TIGR03803 family)